MVWAGVLLAALTIAVLVVGRAEDQPSLRDGAILTGTVNDVGDRAVQDSGGRTITAADIVDRAESSSAGAVTGVAIVDDATRCAWLVGVSGADSGHRHLVAWPSGSQLEWEPFRLTVPQAAPDDLVLESDRVAIQGELFEDLSELDEDDRIRLLGQDGCPHEAIIVVTDQPGALQLVR